LCGCRGVLMKRKDTPPTAQAWTFERAAVVVIFIIKLIMSNTANNITVRTPNEGEVLSIAGGQYRILISGEETGGNYAVIEMSVPPGGGPNPHAHPDMQEMFYVVEGEVEFRTDSGKTRTGKGGFINIPLGGGVHAFKNISGQPAKLLCTVVPSGLEMMFKEVSKASGPDELKAIIDKYRQVVYPVDYFDGK
jgi:quercetin dioxygenase-like cupin family protein